MRREEQNPAKRPIQGIASDPDDFTIEVEPYEGRGIRRIDVRKAAPFGWTPAAVLGVAALMERADNAVIGAVLPKLQEYFGFGDFMAGILLSAPSIAALLLVVWAGKLADTRTRKNVLAIVILSWGLLTFGSAAAPTFAMFFLVRMLLGIAAPLNNPASASIVGDLYPSRGRTKAFAILKVLEYLGLPIGVIFGGILGDAFGWRAAFLIMGVPAVVLAGLFAAFFREPKRGLGDAITAEAEARGIQASTESAADPREDGSASAPVAPVAADGLDGQAPKKEKVLDAIKETMAIPTVRAIMIGQALLFAGASGLFSFATTFFFRVHRDTVSEGASAGIAGMIGLVGMLVGGVLASRIGDRYHGIRPGWRVTTSAWALFISALAVPVFSFAGNLPVQIVCFLILNFGNIIALSNLGAATADVLPAHKRGVGFAALQFLLTIAASTGAVIIGAVSAVVVGRRTSVTQSEIDAAIDSGQPQSVIDGLQQTFWDAQTVGIEWGVGSLSILFILGGLLTFRARRTYEADVRAALTASVED